MIDATKDSMNPVLERSAVGGTNQLVAGTVDFVHAIGKYFKHNGLFIAPEEYKPFMFGGKFVDSSGNTNILGPNFMEKLGSLTSNSFVTETQGFTTDAKTVFTSGKTDFMSGGEFEKEYPFLHALAKAGTVSFLGAKSSVTRIAESLKVTNDAAIQVAVTKTVNDILSGERTKNFFPDFYRPTAFGQLQSGMPAESNQNIIVNNNSSSTLTTNQVSINHPDQVYSAGP